MRILAFGKAFSTHSCVPAATSCALRAARTRAARSHSQRGITLLEALLATAIVAVMLGTLVHLLSDSQTELRAKNVAEQIQGFQRVAAHYFQSNRSQLLDAMDENTSGEAALYCQINVPNDDLQAGQAAFDGARHTCMIDASLLQARKLLAAGASQKTVHGEKLVAIFRRIEDDEQNLTNNVDMLVLTVLDENAAHVKNPQRFVESSSIASYMGATGGVLPDRNRGKCVMDPGSGKYEVCGNGWKVKLDDFLDNGQLSAFDALL